MKHIYEFFKSRRSIREFEPYEVSSYEVLNIVEAAGHAPSSKNTQPWKLYFLQGDKLKDLKAELCKNFDEGVAPTPETDQQLFQVYKPRAVALGKSLLTYKGISREDKEGRRLHDRANFELFNAPQAFILGVDKENHHEGTVLDCGIFLGYLMLSIEGAGFGCCPQASPLVYPQALRSVIPDASNVEFLCVIPFGKPAANSRLNAFEAGRAPLPEWFKKY